MITCLRPSPRHRAKKATVEVSGTWDYKWPRGSRIRVALQLPTSGQREEIVAVWQHIKTLAQSWPESVAKFAPQQAATVWPSCAGDDSPSPYGIGFEFLDSFLESPMGGAAPLGRGHDSPFLRHDLRLFGYDVLISVEDLPLDRIDPFQFQGGAASVAGAPPVNGVERVLMPMSELGAYARRADFGSPTMFIGRFGSALKSRVSLLEHLSTEIGRHIVVQQFGHVLGLGNSHQNPAYTDDRASLYKDADQLAKTVRDIYGLEQAHTTEDVKKHILEVWPGHPTFSDWSKGRSLAELDSVMTFAFHSQLLRSPKLAPDAIRTAPTATDVETLIVMYGSAAGLGQRSSPQAAGGG